MEPPGGFVCLPFGVLTLKHLTTYFSLGCWPEPMYAFSGTLDCFTISLKLPPFCQVAGLLSFHVKLKGYAFSLLHLPPVASVKMFSFPAQWLFF